jgi:hypothetical protein
MNHPAPAEVLKRLVQNWMKWRNRWERHVAGAYWGESGIPTEWRDGLVRRDMIEKALQGLFGDCELMEESKE